MNFKDWCVVVVAIVALIMLMTMLAGCHPTQGIGTVPIVSNPTQTIINTISQTDWTVSLFLLGVVVSLAAALNGMTIGWGCAAACVAGILLKGALANVWIYAVLGLVLTVGVVVFGLSILYKNNALVEIVKGAQKLKVQLANPEANTSQILAKEQSKTTQKLVGDIKTNLKVKGEI